MSKFWINLLYYRKWYCLLFHFVFWDLCSYGNCQSHSASCSSLRNSKKYNFM